MEPTSRISNIHLTLFLSLSLIVLLLFQSCSMDDMTMQPKGDYIGGDAIFIDTNYMTTGGHYALALYNNNPAPFSYAPVVIDSLDLGVIRQGHYCRYKVNWGGAGDYFAAVVWVRNSGGIPLVLGTYGCDTCHSCTSHKVIAFPNFSGANYNIACWNDTTHALN